jgi:hypothetical protein
METNFNFKSQICTDKIQSERLLSLGLKKETADCCYYYYDGEYLIAFAEDAKYESDIPAWSLHRLLCIIPKRIQAYDEVRRYKRNLYLSIDEDFNIRYEENVDVPCFDKIFWSYDIYQNLIDCIEWLIKEGYFNKEYLV